MRRRPPTRPLLPGLLALSLGCSGGTEPGVDRIGTLEFRLDDGWHRFAANEDYLSFYIAGDHLAIAVDDYVGGGPSVHLDLYGYHGSGDYDLSPAAVGFRGELILGYETYTTAVPGGTGKVTVSSVSCTTKEVPDEYGDGTVPVTFCRVSGTFGFVAVGPDGSTREVREGTFTRLLGTKR